MSSLFTQCPHCQTSFRVSSAQLNAAHGLVRCGSCLGVFSASANEIRIKHPDGYIVEELEDVESADEQPDMDAMPAAELADELTEELHDSDLPPAASFVFELAEPERESGHPQVEQERVQQSGLWHNPDEPHFKLGDLSLEELDDAAADTVAENGNGTVDGPVADAAGYYREEEQGTFAPAPRPARLPAEKHALRASLADLNYDDALDPVAEDALPELDDVPVTLTHRSYFRSRLATTLLVVANLLLLAMLPLPWLYTHRSELATHPRFSFLAVPVCRYLDCEQPQPLTVPATLYSQQLLVRSHPTAPNALEVSFVFHNDAGAPENFPALELAFSDINNHLLANRLFKPDEYLPPELRHFNQMPAHSTMQIQLELLDPGKEAVNYKVQLHPLQANR